MESKAVAKIYEVQDEFEGRFLVDHLEANGIPAVLRRTIPDPYSDYLPGFCWGEILVPREEAERAREIIEALL